MDPDDWGVFFDPDDFGTPAAWETTAGDFVEVSGIFEAAREVALEGDATGAMATRPVLTIATVHVPDTAGRDDQIEVADVVYRLAETPQHDGSGITRLILERT